MFSLRQNLHSHPVDLKKFKSSRESHGLFIFYIPKDERELVSTTVEKVRYDYRHGCCNVIVIQYLD